MIELRWAYEKHHPADGECGPPGCVLQYRIWLVRIDASGATTPLPVPIEWSDWITVPAAELSAAIPHDAARKT